jgi:RNA polymerase, sigma subunit, ECF family
MTDAVAQAIEALWRSEAGKLIAHVARIVREVGLAEDLAHDALIAALETWPDSGIPDNPAAWLMTTAKRRALDHLRHRKLAEPLHVELGAQTDTLHAIAEADHAQQVDDALDDAVGDDLLRLIFTACHPLLAPDARAALTLKIVGGLATDEIARAYLVAEATIAQRIVRAKRSLAAARVPFEVPRAAELGARLASVLEVIYLIFNEGYAATSGSDWMRPALCEEALRLGRIVAELMPNEAEAHGLLALMQIQASRLRARVDAHGEPILLLAQDRSRWDRPLIQHGLAALARAQQAAQPHGVYTMQAAIAACHARAPTAADTDWAKNRSAVRLTCADSALAHS